MAAISARVSFLFFRRQLFPSGTKIRHALGHERHEPMVDVSSQVEQRGLSRTDKG